MQGALSISLTTEGHGSPRHLPSEINFSELFYVSRAEGARLEKMEARATSVALNAASAQAKLLVDEVAAQKGTLADTPAQWHERLRGVASVDALISALRDLETQLNVLGDGLPKGI